MHVLLLILFNNTDILSQLQRMPSFQDIMYVFYFSLKPIFKWTGNGIGRNRIFIKILKYFK